MIINKETLLEKLEELGIRDFYYSLDGKSKLDATIIRKHKKKYEVFYMGDHGEIDSKIEFDTIEEAYEYLYNQMVDIKNDAIKYGLDY